MLHSLGINVSDMTSWVKLINPYGEKGRLISIGGNRHELVVDLKIPHENDFMEVTAR